MVQNAYKVTLVGAFIPLVCGIYWKQASTQGAALSAVGGLGVWAICEAFFADATSRPRSSVFSPRRSALWWVPRPADPRRTAGPSRFVRRDAFSRVFRISSLSAFGPPGRPRKVAPSRKTRTPRGGDEKRRNRHDDHFKTDAFDTTLSLAVIAAALMMAGWLLPGNRRPASRPHRRRGSRHDLPGRWPLQQHDGHRPAPPRFRPRRSPGRRGPPRPALGPRPPATPPPGRELLLSSPAPKAGLFFRSRAGGDPVQQQTAAARRRSPAWALRAASQNARGSLLAPARSAARSHRLRPVPIAPLRARSFTRRADTLRPLRWLVGIDTGLATFVGRPAVWHRGSQRSDRCEPRYSKADARRKSHACVEAEPAIGATGVFRRDE